MTPTQIALIQKSFDKVRPIADEAGALFYERLFSIDPPLRNLFKGDMDEQAHKLMVTLAAVVDGLDNLGAIVPDVHALGARHRRYGVKDRDYDTVGQALLWTLEQGLGGDFTPDVRAAWTAAYTLVATTMQSAARNAA